MSKVDIPAEERVKVVDMQREMIDEAFRVA